MCRAQGVNSLPTFRVDLGLLPDLRTHVILAKKIFTKSFVLSQKQKTNNWLADTIRGTGLDVDDDVFEGDVPEMNEEDEGPKRTRSDLFREQQQAIERDRKAMRSMIEKSTANIMRTNSKTPAGRGGASIPHGVANYTKRKKGSFIVVAK